MPLIEDLVEEAFADAFNAWMGRAPNTNPAHLEELRMKAIARREFAQLLRNIAERKDDAP